MNIFKRAVSLLLSASLLGTYAFAADSDNLLANESFNEYATNEIPSDLAISAKAYCISEYEDKNKGLKLYAAAAASSLDIDIPVSKNICVSFDILTGGKNPSGEFEAVNSSGVAQTLLNFSENGDVGAENGFPLGGFGKAKSSYSVVFKAADGLCDVYRNGKKVVSDFKIAKCKISAVSRIRFMFASDTGEDFVILDNVNVTDGEKPRKSYPTAEFNEQVDDENSFTFGEYVGSSAVAVFDFEGGIGPLSIADGGSKVDLFEEEDGNKALLVERQTTSDFHESVNGIKSDSDVLVYDFRFKVLDADSIFNFVQKDSASQFQTLGELGKGAVWYFPVGESINLSLNKWYRVSVIENYYDRTIKYYFDKRFIGSGKVLSNFAANGATADILRFHETIYQSYTPSRAADTDNIKFLLDDIRVYEGNEVKDEIEMAERKIDTNIKKSVFKSDTSYAKMLEGMSAVHARSGVVLKGGEKTLMKNAPFTENGAEYLPVRETLEKLEISYTEEKTGELKIAGGAVLSAQTEGSVIHGGTLYMAADKLFTAAGLSYVKSPAQYNSGLYVLDTSFKAPEDADAQQALNDYMFYLRPGKDMIKSYYESSPQYAEHPRIQATKADFDRVREEVKTDEYKKRWAKTVVSNADIVLTTEPVKYELRDGVRLLGVARDVLSRMYALGMAYQLTDDKKYADRAYTELETVSLFSDWHPAHHLDPCEMAAAVAIGYDWMYDAFTPEQRAVIEKGMYNNCFYDAWLSYQSENSAMTNSAVATNNHNVVCNGGILMGALAMADVYPDEAYYLTSNAIRGLDLMMYHFAPYGTWYEGAHYWEYTMQYTAKMISTMQTVLGSDMGLEECEGLSTSAVSELYMQSPIGIYTYADSIAARIYTPEMFWLSDIYNNADVTKAVLYFTDGNISDSEDLALSLLWYDTSIKKGKIELENDYFDDSQDVVVMRDSWDNIEPTFVGIHAGKTKMEHSQLDGGSFIFENQGVRWAKDLGMGNYNSEGYWDDSPNGKRWIHFRSRAESHNTLVINPNDGPDHKVDSYAKMELKESKPRGSIVTVDMTELLEDNVTSAKRGFFFTDNRKSLVVRDEIDLRGQSDLYWFMITDADAQIDDSGATFTYNGRKMRLDYIAEGANAALSIEKAAPLPSSPKTKPGDDAEETSNRFAIKLTGSGRVNLTVKLSDIDEEMSSVSDYNKSISEWTVPDGDVPPEPSVDKIKVGDKEILTSGKKSIDYVYVEGSLSAPPQTELLSDLYNIDIKNAASLDDFTTVTLTDKNDSFNKAVYKIYFKKILKPVEFDGRESIPVEAYSVSDEPQEANKALNLFDNNLQTRWSAEGTGNWVILDIGSVQRVDDIAIGFMKSGDRKYYFNISVSSDGNTYEKVFDGESQATDSYEFYTLGGRDARYIKIECNGNSNGGGENWNSYTEMVVTRKK